MLTKNTRLNQNETWFSMDNPLMLGLPQYRELSDFVDALAFNPLADIDMTRLSLVVRDAFLTGEKEPLEPTMQSVRAAMTWYGMLTTRLRVANPLIPAAKLQYWTALKAANAGQKALLPTPTSGMSINITKGPTGTGKSITQKRFCASLPQVIDHGRNEAANWNSCRQLVYLVVNVSHDGTRGGLLSAILQEIDVALGTSYSIDLPKRHRTVERLAVATIGRLIAHYCGIIFIDEAQLRNLVETGQAELMQMFLLLLMNSGIPLVLSGNERAFDWVNYSQDISRLHLTPPEIFSPIGALNDPFMEDEWAAIATGVMSYYVLLHPITGPEDCSAVLRRCSGGIARLALTIWCFAQRNCLLNGRETLGPKDIEAAYQSREFADLRPLAEGFYERKPGLLLRYPDIDVDFYCKHWDLPSASSSEKEDEPVRAESERQLKPVKKPGQRGSGKAKFQSEQTRKRKREAKRQEMKESLDPQDIRRRGLTDHHLAGLAAAKASVEKQED